MVNDGGEHNNDYNKEWASGYKELEVEVEEEKAKTTGGTFTG